MPSPDEFFDEMFRASGPFADAARVAFGNWVAEVSALAYRHAAPSGHDDLVDRFLDLRCWYEARVLHRGDRPTAPVVPLPPPPQLPPPVVPLPPPPQQGAQMAPPRTALAGPPVARGVTAAVTVPPVSLDRMIPRGRSQVTGAGGGSAVGALLARFSAAHACQGGPADQPLSPLDGDTEAELLRSLHVALLRLPADLAARWRAEATQVCPDRAADGVSLPALSGHREIFGPVLPGGDGWAALHESAGGVLLAEVAAALGTDPGDTAAHCGLGVPVSWALAVADRDRRVRYASEGASIVEPSTEDGRRIVFSEILFKLETLRSSMHDPVEYLRAMIDVDAALRSLVHFPPVPRDSWWHRLTGASLRCVCDARDQIAQIRTRATVEELTGDYGPLLKRQMVKGGDSDLRYGTGPEQAGQVLACLRLYSVIEGVPHPGRVVFGGRP